ncbi:unnamed protein product [Caenorhabditis nigoni]
MTSKIDESSLKDSKIRASFIFYEFQSGKPKSDCYKNICDRMGPNFMDHKEFEFWFQRFSAGNFDIDISLSIDGSQDPKYRTTINDMPMHVFEEICKKLGDKNEYRFTLRHVCKSFRALADSWIPKFQIVAITAQDAICVRFDEKIRNYGRDEERALSDLISIIAHPRYQFENFWIDNIVNTELMKKLVQKLESGKLKIQVEKFYLNRTNWRDQMLLLPFYQAETVKTVHIHEYQEEVSKFIEEICKIDKEVQAGSDKISKLFSRMEITLRHLYIEEATTIIKNLLQFSNLEYCYMLAAVTTPAQLRKIIENFGAKIQTDRPYILHYPIPSSADFFEIQVQTDYIRIKRKSA